MSIPLTSQMAVTTFIAYIAKQIHEQSMRKVENSPRCISHVKFRPQDICNFSRSLMACRNVEPTFSLNTLRRRFSVDWVDIFKYDQDTDYVWLCRECLPQVEPDNREYKGQIVIHVSQSINAPFYEYEQDDLRFMCIID